MAEIPMKKTENALAFASFHPPSASVVELLRSLRIVIPSKMGNWTEMLLYS